MQNHVKIYLQYFSIGQDDTWYCEACLRQFHITNGLDIHHINGRGAGKNVIGNLMCLCRKCHEKAHSTEDKGTMQYKHNSFIAGKRKKYFK